MTLKNGSCEQAFKNSMGFCYRFVIQLRPLNNSITSTSEEERSSPNKQFTGIKSTEDLETIEQSLEKQILAIADDHGTDRYLRKISFYETDQPSDNKVSNKIIFSDVFFYMDLWGDVEGFLKKMNDLYNDNNISLVTGTKLNYFAVNLVRLQKAATKDGVISPWTEKVLKPYYNNTIRSSEDSVCVGGQVITVTPFYFHPFVSLDRFSYTWTVNASGIIVHELNLFINNSMFRESENKSVIFISARLLQDVLENTGISRISPVRFSDVEGFVTLVFVCLSIICLLITLFTYMLFPTLKSQPGINNMILCTCLIAGYLLFTFGIGQTDLEFGCKIMGGVVHFSWVFVFFWTNVCSFHMYRAFGTLNQFQASNNKLAMTTKYFLYSIFSTSLVIGINIGITYYTTEGASLGYGSEKTGLCYVYEPMMTVYTVALPAISLAILNITMFVIVVCRVQRVTDITKHVQNEKNYFSVYIRLSTITGMAWIAAIPMMLSDLVVFNYIFIILTCSQGIYLMLAFTCTKKVRALYSEKWSSSKAPCKSTYICENQTSDTKINFSEKRSDTIILEGNKQLNYI